MTQLASKLPEKYKKRKILSFKEIKSIKIFTGFCWYVYLSCRTANNNVKLFITATPIKFFWSV